MEGLSITLLSLQLRRFKMKCGECESSLIFIDSEQDIVWCKSCGHIETVDYKPQPDSFTDKVNENMGFR